MNLNRILWSNLILLCFLAACQTTPEKILEPAQTLGFQGKVYVGDSLKGGVTRNATEPTILCTESQFDKFICMNYGDFKTLMDKILNASCNDVPTPSPK